MITKIAVTAWKRLFPYLGKADQGRIIETIRKPLEEYNAGVAKGTRNIARRKGIEVIGDDGKSLAADVLTAPYGGARAIMAGKRALNTVKRGYTPEVREAVRKQTIEQGYDPKETDAFFKELDALTHKYNQRTDVVPMIMSRRFETAEDAFRQNAALRHELAEQKYGNRYYKVSPYGNVKTPLKKVELVRPTYPGLTEAERVAHPEGINSHVSLEVIGDELKDALKSGHMDLHTRLDLDKNGYATADTYSGILAERMLSGEMGQLLRAGKDRLFTAPKRYTKSLRNGVVKRDQKRFFKNVEKAQKAVNIPNPENKPSLLDDVSKTYLWPGRPIEEFMPILKGQR